VATTDEKKDFEDTLEVFHQTSCRRTKIFMFCWPCVSV